MSGNGILVVLAVAVVVAAVGVHTAVSNADQRRRAEVLRRLHGAPEVHRSTSLLRERRLARSPGFARFLENWSFALRIELLLMRTDLTMTVESVIAAGLLIGLAVSLLFLFAVASQPLLALIGPPVGFAVPIFFVMATRDRRINKLSQQLPEALDMMARSLRAGHGIAAGFQLVASELPLPVSIEFARCVEEQNAGVSLRDSVVHMAERTPENLDIKMFAVALIIQQETGGNLVEILEQIATTVRARYQFYGKLRTLTAEARVSGIVLAVLPFFCALAISVTNRGYLMPLVHDRFGLLLLGIGAILWALGILWMRKLAQVDM